MTLEGVLAECKTDDDSVLLWLSPIHPGENDSTATIAMSNAAAKYECDMILRFVFCGVVMGLFQLSSPLLALPLPFCLRLDQRGIFLDNSGLRKLLRESMDHVTGEKGM